MFEYAAFNPFNASPEGLAAELTRKSAEGWEVVSITTTTDGRFCAFLRRPVAQRTTATTTATVAAATSAPTTASDPGYGAAAASATSAPSAANPSVPAAWYKDPSGRYELRYWNGAAWTEHVARGGQQFTDPPVA
jgi:hypothetical protein